ncbi:MAG: helix-turn-helix domain-containing protein [Chloroflexota bacterium]|nr:helix-turn-helix domain-containing protein [Chloroflexota bacterium]
MKIADGTELLTLKEAAARIGVSPITLQQQIRKGVLHAVRLGNQWVVTADDLRAYTATRQGKRGFASPSHPYHGLRPPRKGDDATDTGGRAEGTDGTHAEQEA